MALSLSNFLYISAVLCLSGLLVEAKLVTYDFNITWVTRNPDGLEARPVMGINGQWPVPLINVTKGDRVIVNVENQLGNQSTSLHFHGLYQNGTNEMDGPVGVTQCPIPPGSKFTYDFTVDQPGTYWYHSHVKGQYPDGLRGPMIIQDPDSPYKGMYDEELVLSVSDWYHEQMPYLLQQFVNVANPTGAEPVPDSALFNDSQNITFSVQPGKTYFVRMVNLGAFAGQYFWIEGHTMQIVEVDGIWTEPADADMIYLTAAQRYGFLLTAHNNTDGNFAFVSSMDESLFDKVPAALNPNVTGWLVYDQQKSLPTPALKDSLLAFDDFYLVPHDKQELLGPVDQSITLDLTMDNLGDGANYAFFNGITYVPPKVPSLYTVLSTGANATNPVVYGVNTHPFILKHNEVVEIILNNNDAGKHPFHLHGHAFQAVLRSNHDEGFYAGSTSFAQVPMRRDTFMVRPNGNFVIRFRADNPGIWMFHCHIDWHLATGLAATMVEAPLEMQQKLTIPQDHYQACRDSNMPYQGNAAGNTADVFDLTGEPAPPAPLPAGFTARGIVALVFSCISAFLGLAVISWYGAAPIGKGEVASAQRIIYQAGVEEL